MADIFSTPNSSRFVETFAFGDTIDVVNWPGGPSAATFSGIAANTLMVMPFMAGYLLNYDALNFISNGITNITWGLYSYDPSDRSGTLLNSTGQITTPSPTTTQIVPFIAPGTLYPGRTYAVALNSSTLWNMLVLNANAAGCNRILGGDYSGGNFQNYTHLRTGLTYNAVLPANLPATVKSNAIWPPNPLFRAA